MARYTLTKDKTSGNRSGKKKPEKEDKPVSKWDAGYGISRSVDRPTMVGLPIKSVSKRQDKPETGKEDIEERKKGGPVKKGKKYIVGEKGPEVFVPKKDGKIIPNKGKVKSHAAKKGKK